jgi:[heparan sulfate]-glucosamine 3-sulfotransferase 3
VIKVEQFLNLNKFFVPEHYIFDKNKGYYCMNKILFNSTENRCLGKTKGRKHSEIDENALDKLREFYKPYSLELFEILKQKPFWEI